MVLRQCRLSSTRLSPSLLLLFLPAFALLGGCASFSTPNRITLSRAEPQGLLNRSFPKERSRPCASAVADWKSASSRRPSKER